MVDYRKVIVSLTIALLFMFFVQASIQAVSSPPSYIEFCDLDFPDKTSLSEEEFEEQRERYDEELERCTEEYNEADTKYSLFVFIISGVLGLIAIFVALKIPSKQDVSSMVSSGLLLGGLITLFVGTIRGWGGIDIYLRPLVLLLELLLVIYLAYLTMSPKKKKSK